MAFEVQRTERLAEVFSIWIAARDLGDVPMQLTARRVVQALLDHKQPRVGDLETLATYFR